VDKKSVEGQAIICDTLSSLGYETQPAAFVIPGRRGTVTLKGPHAADARRVCHRGNVMLILKQIFPSIRTIMASLRSQAHVTSHDHVQLRYCTAVCVVGPSFKRSCGAVAHHTQGGACMGTASRQGTARASTSQVVCSPLRPVYTPSDCVSVVHGTSTVQVTFEAMCGWSTA
jgi:hypothetical protein